MSYEAYMVLPCTVAPLKNSKNYPGPGNPYEAEDLFNQAVQEGWNRETEWLWLAGKVVNEYQKIYAYEQVLSINPDNESAVQALKRLSQKNIK